uniref:Zona pellucida sperm-binding protein 4 n=1 Tax=Latimeria chalumnae TaxID=7897 RepID=H3AHA9_LATCH
CEVPSGRRVACSGPGTGEVNCKREGCCYTPDDPKMPCYYGNTELLCCSKNGQFVILVAKEMTRPSLDLNSVYLKGGSGAACRPIGDSLDLLVFKFPVSACGTIKQVEGDSVVYETKVVATRKILQGPRGNITRQSYFRLTVQCRYNGSASEQLQANVLTLAPPLPATDKGDLQIQLRIAKVSLLEGGEGGETEYNSWYLDSDYPVVKFLRDPVFVEVRILGRTDPSIVLMLGDCWATPNGNPQSNIIWNILVNGCSFAGDNYQTVLHEIATASGLQFPAHHKHFEVKTFVFMEDSGRHPLSGEVYIHCHAAVCRPSAQETCSPTCRPPSRKVSDVQPMACSPQLTFLL